MLLYLGHSMEEPRRLARVVQTLLGSSYTRARHEVEIGHVTVNGVVVSNAGAIVADADEIEHRPDLRRLQRHRNLKPIDVVHLDEHILVVNKPAGLVVHPTVAGEQDTVLSRAGAAVEAMSGRHRRVFVVHRLDQDTSGLMVFALSHQAAEHLHRQLKTHLVTRRYLALAAGDLAHEERVDRNIGRPRPGARRAALGEGKGRPALTFLRPLERYGVFTLVEAELGTGRTHQVRVHLSYLGHPVLADSIYGGHHESLSLAPRLALHATHLELTHPVTGARMAFDCPLPDDMAGILREQRRRGAPRPPEEPPRPVAREQRPPARERRGPRESVAATPPPRRHTPRRSEAGEAPRRPGAAARRPGPPQRRRP
jgi:23S rRNA pseudouridine1911/1915/1917 synthase